MGFLLVPYIIVMQRFLGKIMAGHTYESHYRRGVGLITDWTIVISTISKTFF